MTWIVQLVIDAMSLRQEHKTVLTAFHIAPKIEAHKHYMQTILSAASRFNSVLADLFVQSPDTPVLSCKIASPSGLQLILPAANQPGGDGLKPPVCLCGSSSSPESVLLGTSVMRWDKVRRSCPGNGRTCTQSPAHQTQHGGTFRRQDSGSCIPMAMSMT